MKKVTLTLNEKTSRFEAKDIDGAVYYTAKRKSDLKTSLKRSKLEFEIVEAFEIVEPVKIVIEKQEAPKVKEIKVELKIEKPAKEVKKSTKTTYEDYKQYIITNFTNADLYSKSEKIANFCEKFNLTLSKAGRNLTFEKTLTKMIDDGIIEYTVEGIPTGKYKKLTFQYTEQHKAFMSPDEDEEL